MNPPQEGPRPRILVAGVGNIFLGDDAFGCAVAQRLAEQGEKPGVRVIDFGIRGLELTYALLDDGYDAAILIDAAPRGLGPAGTLYVLEPQVEAAADAVPGSAMIEGHSMDPMRILKAVGEMGGKLRIVIVGCEPGERGEAEMRMEMSPAVGKAVEEAAGVVQVLVERMRNANGAGDIAAVAAPLVLPAKQSPRPTPRGGGGGDVL